MKKPQHTPGPWRALPDGHVSVDTGKDRTVADVYAPGVEFNAADGDDEYYSVVDANTKLIASAPALLAERDVLRQALIDLLASADASWEERRLGHDWAEACEAARAALNFKMEST
jgi:hypothetical protein